MIRRCTIETFHGVFEGLMGLTTEFGVYDGFDGFDNSIFKIFDGFDGLLMDLMVLTPKLFQFFGVLVCLDDCGSVLCVGVSLHRVNYAKG